MKYFIDGKNVIYAYEEDGSQDELIGNKTPITAEQADALLNPPPTPEQLIVQAEQQKMMLKAAADAEIAWRQDAVDAGIATAEETATLSEWRNYRVLLMRVDTKKTPEIEWPTVLIN